MKAKKESRTTEQVVTEARGSILGVTMNDRAEILRRRIAEFHRYRQRELLPVFDVIRQSCGRSVAVSMELLVEAAYLEGCRYEGNEAEKRLMHLCGLIAEVEV
jgi:hypothetical protein